MSRADRDRAIESIRQANVKHPDGRVLWLRYEDFPEFFEDTFWPDGEVTVVDKDGKQLFRGVVGYSLVALVESIDAKRDPQMWFDGWIELP